MPLPCKRPWLNPEQKVTLQQIHAMMTTLYLWTGFLFSFGLFLRITPSFISNCNTTHSTAETYLSLRNNNFAMLLKITPSVEQLLPHSLYLACVLSPIYASHDLLIPDSSGYVFMRLRRVILHLWLHFYNRAHVLNLGF